MKTSILFATGFASVARGANLIADGCRQAAPESDHARRTRASRSGAPLPVRRLALCCAVLLAGTAGSARGDSFMWLGGGGDFLSWSNWIDRKNQSFDPPIANPLHRLPGAGDIVGFPQDLGSYTVNVDNATVLGTAIFDMGGGGVVTLNVNGEFQLGQTQMINVVITGEGTVRSSSILMQGCVLSGVKAEFSNLLLGVNTSKSGPALTVQDNATLTTIDPLTRSGGVMLNEGEWTHTGIASGGPIEALNSSRLVVKESNAAAAPTAASLRVEGGSSADIDHFEGRVDASGAGAVTFKRAHVYSDQPSFDPSTFSGGGTTLTVAERLSVMGGPLQFLAGGRLQTPLLTDDSSVEAIDSGSAINITGLLDGGSAAAKTGGSAAVATAKNAALSATGAGSTLSFNTLTGEAEKTASFTALSGGVLSGGSIAAVYLQGTVRSPDSILTLTGDLEGDNVQLKVDEGGRIDCAQAVLGDDGATFTDVTVTGTNSFFLARQGLILGDKGARINMTVSSAGRAQTGLTGSAAVSAIGLTRGADGRLTVNTGGVFDARLSSDFGVGIGAKGQITVISGGRVLASNLTLGALAGGTGLVSVSGSDSSLEVGQTLFVGSEGQGTLNILSKGIVEAGSVWVGSSAADNVLSVTGGAELHFGTLYPGYEGRGTVRVTAGGIVTGTGQGPRIGIGNASSSAAGTLEVTGAGSRVNLPNGGAVVAGVAGQGTLLVNAGAELHAAIGIVGGAGGSSGTATISGAGSRWNLTGTLDVGGFAQPVPGSLMVADSATIRVGETMGVTSAGVVTLNGGSISVGTGDAPAGTLRVGAGGTLKLGGRVTGGKVIQGIGGRILPGNSPGISRMEAGFEQQAGAILEMEIAGATPGTLYDQIIVTGAAALSGTLTVRFTGGFAPAPGQVFDLVTAGTLTSSVASATILGLQAGFQHQLRTTPEGKLQLVALNAGTPVTSPPAAELSIESIHGLVVVSYPPELTGWTLQASSDLSSAGNWTAVDAPGHRLTFAPSISGRRFFRLKKN